MLVPVDGAGMDNPSAVLEVHHIVIAGFIVYLLMVEVLRRLAEDPNLLQRCEAEIGATLPEATPASTKISPTTGSTGGPAGERTGAGGTDRESTGR